MKKRNAYCVSFIPETWPMAALPTYTYIISEIKKKEQFQYKASQVDF